MSVFARLSRRLLRSGRPRGSVRLRLTLLYGGLFLASGAALLALTYWQVAIKIRSAAAVDFHEAPAVAGGKDPAEALEPAPGNTRRALVDDKAALLDDLLNRFGITLAVMVVVSIALGWIVAGRILRPLQTITAAAQEISATSLHQRLDLDGPADELKELGDTFDSLLSRLESSFEAQRRFVANASHELRTPLARQRTLGQVVLADPDATVESLRAAHERILAAGAQQERLIEALLTLARSQGGIDVREPFDLARLTQEVIDSREVDAEQRAVVFLPAVSAATAAGHRNLTERLITNLVDNALRHNARGGRVDVTVGTVDGRATITVANTGPVVPPDQVARLFQPFQRLDATRAARTEGLGLGLSIVQAIAYAHDATVTTRARPEGGLTIAVAFPSVSERPVPPRAVPERVAPSPGTAERVAPSPPGVPERVNGRRSR
ncbi:sensor histidine kinase [Streptomyces jumonjinensis]|uniref:sensor histidine kinase n=1 Tax=Streptomyces jumonjinensis TaxID=1945 RepID=UPI0037AC3624